jgi:hypothetical protein
MFLTFWRCKSIFIALVFNYLFKSFLLHDLAEHIRFLNVSTFPHIYTIWIALLNMVVSVLRVERVNLLSYFNCQHNSVFSLIIHTYFQVFEIKNDAKMKRTMRRPLPSGRISPAHAAMWATSVGAAGTALLAWKVLTFSLHFIHVYVYFLSKLLSCRSW